MLSLMDSGLRTISERAGTGPEEAWTLQEKKIKVRRWPLPRQIIRPPKPAIRGLPPQTIPVSPCILMRLHSSLDYQQMPCILRAYIQEPHEPIVFWCFECLQDDGCAFRQGIVVQHRRSCDL